MLLLPTGKKAVASSLAILVSYHMNQQQASLESKLPLSFFTVYLQVSLGLPLHCLPSRVQGGAIFGLSFN